MNREQIQRQIDRTSDTYTRELDRLQAQLAELDRYGDGDEATIRRESSSETELQYYEEEEVATLPGAAVTILSAVTGSDYVLVKCKQTK